VAKVARDYRLASLTVPSFAHGTAPTTGTRIDKAAPIRSMRTDPIELARGAAVLEDV
jgi:hypothetical protein